MADRSTASARPPGREITACVLVIGNEVLSGRTRDVNVQTLASGLGAVGIRVREARVVPDDMHAIVEAVNETRARFDHVFTTGGIGPTHDDITAAAIARAFGLPLEENAEALRRLALHYGTGDLNEARRKMACIPRGAALIDNPVSQAPGFRVGNVHALAGVPRICQAMFDGLKHGLVGGRPVESRAVTAWLREGDLAAPLAAVQEAHPAVEIGSYPFVRGTRIGVTIICRAPDPAAAAAAAAVVADLMRSLGAVPEDGDHAEAPGGASQPPTGL